jgi:outer membrane protein TolC
MMSRNFSQAQLLVGVLLAFATSHTSALAQKPQPLPEPLTLTAALAVADSQSPEVLLAMADVALEQARQTAVAANDAFQLRLEGGLVRREFAGREESFDNAYLVMQKQLYDFGRQQAALSSVEAQVRSQEWLLAQAKIIYRQRVIDAYFDVLLADMTARVEDEQMAIEYVALDNAKEEQAQGKVSELEIAALDDGYQRTLVRRSHAELNQRLTRAKLVELLGYAGQLPSELEMPDLTPWRKRQLGDVKQLQEIAVTQNLHLKALSEQLAAAEFALTSAQQMDAPVIEFRGRNGWHTHVEDRYDGRYRYDLAITMPIIDGGLKSAAVDTAKAKMMQQKARYEQMMRDVRQLTLDTALKIGLLKSRQTQTQVQGDYAERYLDKSRTEYQFERKTDLGDALVKVSRAELDSLKLARDQVVLWEQLSGLIGEKP